MGGQTQGGGAMMTHVPKWGSVLFDNNNDDSNNNTDEDDALFLTKKKLADVLQNDNTNFQMPLGAPYGAKKMASMPLSIDDCEQVMDRLWKILGGTTDNNDVDEEGLSPKDVAAGLSETAMKFGSQSDSMTYSAFEKAMRD